MKQRIDDAGLEALNGLTSTDVSMVTPAFATCECVSGNTTSVLDYMVEDADHNTAMSSKDGAHTKVSDFPSTASFVLRARMCQFSAQNGCARPAHRVLLLLLRDDVAVAVHEPSTHTVTGYTPMHSGGSGTAPV
jgi:hypothetical protein